MDEQQPHGSIPRQCTATSKRSRQRCRKSAMRGRTVCRSHGGATPRGIASPHLKHGRWSKDLPTQLARRYEQSLDDPELFSLRNEIALVDMRISTLLTTEDTHVELQNGTRWQEIARLIEQRRRLTESEVRHRVTAGQMLALDQAVALAAALAASVHKHVEDPEVVTAVQRDLEQLLESAGGQ